MNRIHTRQTSCGGSREPRINPQRYWKRLGGAVAMLLLVMGTSYAEWVNIGPRSFIRLCPEHIGGDGEYNGHGPWVSGVSASLFKESNDTDLHVHFSMHQIETRWNWTEAQLSRSFRLYRAPFGKRITFIWNAPYSEVPAYEDENTSVERRFPMDNLVEEFQIMGDTRGRDVGECSADHAFLTAFLEPIWVFIQ